MVLETEHTSFDDPDGFQLWADLSLVSATDHKAISLFLDLSQAMCAESAAGHKKLQQQI